MTREEFKKIAGKQYILLDGATGSNLIKKGLPAGVCPEKWIIEHPQVEIDLISSYVENGSHIILAPTFSANRIKLSEYGLYDQMEDMIASLMDIAKKGAKDKAYIAGDISMTGLQVEPLGPLSFDELVDIYKEQIRYLVKYGADLLIVETMMSLQEMRAAMIAAKEECDLPVLCSFSFESDGRTLFGSDPKTCVLTMESLGACAVGANCSSGPDLMADIIKKMREVSSLPLIAKPNAGLPILLEDGSTGYSMNAQEFKEVFSMLLDAGASIVGGCCGTDPSFIAEIAKLCRDRKPVNSREFSFPDSTRSYLTSERSSYVFDLHSPFGVVGERINPTGKKKLQAELLENKLSMVLQFAEDQEKQGADVLDVNFGLGGIDEKAMMLRALKEITQASSLPLCIDSSLADVMEQALRIYPGRALINSITLDEDKYKMLFPIAKKYGAMAILLPLSEAGVPATFEDRKKNIDSLINLAKSYGLSENDIFIDPLVMTVGATPEAGGEILKTIAYLRSIGVKSICGLSNVSFGLPERGYVNATFLSMAILSGLNMAICNPSQTLLMATAKAADILMNKENATENYISYASQIPKDIPAAAPVSPVLTKEVSGQTGSTMDKVPAPLRKLYEHVLKGHREDSLEETKSLIDSHSPQEILNDSLMVAMNEVGDLYDKGKYFLPQLIASAESMQNAISVLVPLLKNEGQGTKYPTVVIATVKGDIHDIGKNLVSLMLTNAGFTVIDLGKDVPNETIVEQAIENKASVIALSALMTTTMVRMPEVIALAREKAPGVKVVVGGAAVTKDYADRIGADGYSESAAECVKLISELLNITS